MLWTRSLRASRLLPQPRVRSLCFPGLEFLPEELDFENTKYDIEIYGDEAEVQIIEGTASYIDPITDEKVVEDAAFVDMEPLDLVKVDGKWYITSRFYEDG